MIKVLIYKKGKELPYQNLCKDIKEAEEWVKNHKAKGKDAQIITAPTRIQGAKFLEEVDGPMGVKLLKQELPAEYTVEYIEEHLHGREQKWKELIAERDNILCKTDWLFISDVRIESKHRKIYMEYRQYLRDLPQRIKNNDVIQIESFSNWMRRKCPEEFLDGGDGEKIIERFTYYL